MPAPPPPTRPKVTVAGLGADRREEVLALDQLAFSNAPDEPGPDAQVSGGALEWDRVFGASVDGDTGLTGIYAVYSLGLSVPHGPGARVTPMAGLSWVGVHPGHHRQGVASAMVRHHLHGLHESGAEPVSGLRASEPAIYGRFSYGLATAGLQLTVPHGAALREVPGAEAVTVRWLTVDPHRDGDLIEALHEKARVHRPGLLARSPQLRARWLVDNPAQRAGREPLRLLLAERDGEPTGYAVLRRTGQWDRTRFVGTASVHEIVALDPPTGRALWGVLVDLDLMTTMTTPSLAADDPLLSLLVDVRSTAPVLSDDLWLRLVDVDRALAARGYAHDVDVVIGLTDALCPWNARRWHLTAGPDGAACVPTSDPAQVLLDVRELASAYLGGTSLVALAAAGLVREERAGAVAHLSVALRSALQPVSPMGF
ncbi:MAG: GNAT family N-acetyltransferase [Rhodoferax sp.]|nr:GNAT family N-acetyltransferase [Actinomycetota bacterium]